MKFKKGQKVRLVCHGILGEERESWTEQVDMNIGDVNTVIKLHPDNCFGPCISIDLRSRYDWVFHEDHFGSAKLSNEERIAVRVKELANV